MLHDAWPGAWHRAESFELEALIAEVNNNCPKEGEAESGAADSPPPAASYQELRPAHARDMQPYALDEPLFKAGAEFARARSPERSPPRIHYEPYAPHAPHAPPAAYAHDHHADGPKAAHEIDRCLPPQSPIDEATPAAFGVHTDSDKGISQAFVSFVSAKRVV
ncbi:unnamed protein product, partial [Iphiclides podalirius]